MLVMADPSGTGAPRSQATDKEEKTNRHYKAQTRSVTNEYLYYHRHPQHKTVILCLLLNSMNIGAVQWDVDKEGS